MLLFHRHFNMNRIRLVWSRIWNVLSDFFVSVGLSENLSVAIFVMDSLRQLAMKFLEREELANYNFQNEFLRPFAIVMQKSTSAEIRELIVRCISQMVLSRVSNVKSGWKSVFMISQCGPSLLQKANLVCAAYEFFSQVFTTAAADERKSIVLLAFGTMEKIVREYFPYITETESATFTDCVRCLLTFTNSKFDSDVCLNAIAFLRFCAVKLAEGGLVCNEDSRDEISFDLAGSGVSFDGQTFTSKDENVYFWMPLLTGLSKLTSDPRSAIRKSSLEVLFNILKDHGSVFSRPFWNDVLNFVVFPLFGDRDDGPVNNMNDRQLPPASGDSSTAESAWNSETFSLAAEHFVDLFVTFFSVLRSQLPGAVSVLTGFFISPGRVPAKTGVGALVRLTSELSSVLSEDDWGAIFTCIKDAAASTLGGFVRIFRAMDNIEIPDAMELETSSQQEISSNDLEDDELQTTAYVASRMKTHIALQLIILQLVTDLYKTHHKCLSVANIKILLEIFSSVSSHAYQLNSEIVLQRKLQIVCNVLRIPVPRVVHFQNDSYQYYLNFLQNILSERGSSPEDAGFETEFGAVCEKMLLIYLECAGTCPSQQKPGVHWILPLPPVKKEELGTRTCLAVSALRALISLEQTLFKRYISRFFPLVIDLVKSEHTSEEVLSVLKGLFETCIGPIIIEP
ncbi:hypothetical protein Cgig2_014839 [Carnegiea gigantea]|uniref:Uncharacterized protein n=1 Tax=Carnegiea gigantea TaxID=171969 RepID=A0A9Q1QTK7_9CARY|nr:hypothetical protein Cgig2_014839 [Carnegiea gigantea]